jgi:hypothetical protein
MVWNQQEEIVNSLGKGSGRGSRLFTKLEKTGDSFNIDGRCLYLACGVALRRRYSPGASCLCRKRVCYQHASGSTLDAYGNIVNAAASIGDIANSFPAGSRNQAVVRVGMLNKF